MDELDLKILKLLEQNGRLSHEEIGKLLHLSRPSVHQRVAKLEKNGIIKGYRGLVDWSRLDQKIKVVISVKDGQPPFPGGSGQNSRDGDSGGNADGMPADGW